MDPLPHNIIRPYEARDRDAVWKICCDTADQGNPVEKIFRDRDVVADFLIRYYTEYEPEAMWVAEEEGRVIGYLSGCLNNRRYRRVMMWLLGPKAILKATGRGLFVSQQTWQFLWRVLRSWLEGKWPCSIPEDVYPGHLHVNVEQGFRGHEVGRRLVERFCEQAHAAGLKGVYASVNAHNTSACQFFERLHFVSVGPSPTVPVEKKQHISDRVIYGIQF